MKKFIMGFLTAALLFTAIPIGAAIEEYICYRADYKVMVNGEQYISNDLPILNYKGSTYAPFRSILEAAGLNVNWNAELGQAEVTTPNTKEDDNVIEYDATTGLPVGATYTEYNKTKKAVLYNGNTYLSTADLYTIFGIKFKTTNVKDGTTTFGNSNGDVVINISDRESMFFNSVGSDYYNVNLFVGITGE